MTKEQSNYSEWWKNLKVAGIVVFVLAISYEGYIFFNKDLLGEGDYSRLIMNASLFIALLIPLLTHKPKNSGIK